MKKYKYALIPGDRCVGLGKTPNTMSGFGSREDRASQPPCLSHGIQLNNLLRTQAESLEDSKE